jgi:hypothetical protein
LGHWLIYPVLHLVYTLIRGAIVGFYPYPFFNPNRPTTAGHRGVTIYCLTIVIAFLVVAWPMAMVANRWQGARAWLTT